MRTALLHRAQRLAAAPAGAAAACTSTSYFGQRGSANATARASSAAASRLRCYKYPNQLQLQVQRRVFSSTTAEAPAKVAAEAAPAAAAKATVPPAASKGNGNGGGFVAWYEKHLEASPVKTKAITGSILWGVGDAVAQIVPHVMFDDVAEEDTKKKAGAASDGGAAVVPASKPDFAYDFARTGRAAFFGFAIHAPLSHVHYNFLEWMTVRAGFTGLQIPVFKTIMEQFVYWSWFSNSLYHGAMGAMQGWSAQQCYVRIADVLWETQKAQWVFWIPVQLVNFQFVPVRHQLNVVLLTSIVWTALLSAWYPPGESEEEGKEKVVVEQPVADKQKDV